MNFFQLNLFKDSFIDLSLNLLNNFLINSSFLQKNKYQQFLNSNLLKYCLIFLKIDKHLKHFPYNLFDLNCSDFNKYDDNFGTSLSPNRTEIDNLRDKEIEHFNSLKEDSQINKPFFEDILQELEKYDIDISCSYMIYKKNAVISRHQHNPDTIALHILLEDVKDGSLDVIVNDKLKQINRRGEYILLETMNPHSANFTGSIGKVLSFGFCKSNLNEKRFLEN